jgi:hypothetical protein
MSIWCKDFATSSLQEIFKWQGDNRAWSKELRQKISSLVTSRLAHEISFADYLADRKLVHADTAECRRRATILDAQMIRCTVGSLPPGELRTRMSHL